jgi:accessory gene regulator protein AgrB
VGEWVAVAMAFPEFLGAFIVNHCESALLSVLTLQLIRFVRSFFVSMSTYLLLTLSVIIEVSSFHWKACAGSSIHVLPNKLPS